MNYSPSTTEKLVILVRDYEMFALPRTLRNALSYWLMHPADDFDHRYGVATGDDAPVSEAEIADPVLLENALDYGPTRAPVMRHILRHVRKHFELPKLTFVDLGCGKGRALLMAAEHPFRAVVGVEISEPLFRAAQQNVAAWQPKAPEAKPIRVYHADATRFDYPAGDLLIYMFNPFQGPVLRAVLDRLAAIQACSDVRVHAILSNPETQDVLHAHPAFSKQYECRVINQVHSWSLWRCQSA